jgi:hypothetical protein
MQVRSQIGPRLLHSVEHGYIAEEVRCLQNACNVELRPCTAIAQRGLSGRRDVLVAAQDVPRVVAGFQGLEARE